MANKVIYNSVLDKYFLEISKEQAAEIQLQMNTNQIIDPASVITNAELDSLGIPSIEELNKNFRMNNNENKPDLQELQENSDELTAMGLPSLNHMKKACGYAQIEINGE